MSPRRAFTVTVTCFFGYFAFRAVRDGGLGVLAHLAVAPTIGAFAFLVMGNNVLSGLRWWILQGFRGTPGEAIRRLSESVFFSVVLPTGSIGGDVYRGVNTGAAAPVVADRLIGASVTFVCAAAAIPAFLGYPVWLSIGLAFASATVAYASRTLVANLRLGPMRVRQAARRLADITTPMARVGPAILLTLGYVFCNALFLMLLASAVGAHLGPGQALIGSPIVLAAGAIPNVHGLSLLQVALVAVFVHAGIKHDQAAAAAAAQLLSTYLLAAGGGLLLLARRARTRRSSLPVRNSEVISL